VKTVESVLVLAVVAKLVDQAFGLLPRLSALLIRSCACLLPPQQQERWLPEWLAELEAHPGPEILTFFWAFGVSIGAVRIGCRARAASVLARRRRLRKALTPDSKDIFMLGFIFLLFALYLVYRDRMRKDNDGQPFLGDLARATASPAEGAAVLSKSNIWTARHEDGWANRRDGDARPAQIFKTKREALDAGRDIARRDHVEHVIQNRDGKIAERNLYGI
jgi:hypothetical protein